MQPTRRIMLAVAALVVAFSVSCANATDGASAATASPSLDETSVSIAIPRLSPAFAELFSATRSGGGSSRALIGASKVELALYKGDATEPFMSWTVDTPTLLGDGNTNVSTSKIIPDDTGICSVVAKVYNSAVSEIEPVAQGQATQTIAANRSNSISVYCLPTASVLASLPFSGTPSPTPFAISANSSVTAMGQELWYKFVPSGCSVTVSCQAAAGNGNTIGGIIYDASGKALSANFETIAIKASASAPYLRYISVTPGDTYYIGLAQSSGQVVGSNDFSIGIADGPDNPAAPTLTVPVDSVGEIDLAWTPAARVSSYDLWYKDSHDTYGSGKLYGNYPASSAGCKLTDLDTTLGYAVWLVARVADDNWASGAGTAATALPMHVKTLLSANGRSWKGEAVGRIPDGSASYSAGTFSLTGGGLLGLGSGELPMEYVHASVSGNFTLIAHIATVSAQSTGHQALAGISVCEAVAAIAKDCILGINFTDKGSGAALMPGGEIRYFDEGSTGWGGAVPITPWLKMQRIGSTLKCWVSTDGIAWTQQQLTSYTVSTDTWEYFDPSFSAATLEVGFFVNANAWYDQATANFDNVSLTTP
jgi:hypothetical protein